MFAKMTETKTESCQKFDSLQIMTFKYTVRKRYYKLQNGIFESIWVSRIRVEIIPFDNGRWKKRVFKEIMIGFKQWNIYVVPGTVSGVPNLNCIE